MPFVQFNFGFPSDRRPRVLSLRTTALLLIFGLTLLLIHLGDGRVLTRHEVLAAQPGREMLHDGTFTRWMLPTLAGVPREAKPPGMMWLIAASIYVFRSEAAWVACLPSILAGLFIALMIARLTARWFGDRLGRIAGLLQLTFVYILMQAKLAEADMCLTAAVCAALCSLAVGVIDSPHGMETSRKNRLTFWLAAAATILLKGPIGLVLIVLTIAFFALLQRDWRFLKFLIDPIGIACFAILIVGWPVFAWSLDPPIIQVWHTEIIGNASGVFGREPFYYYVWSVPLMLLPWLPFTAVGLRRGPNAELTGSVAQQTGRATLWRFLLCWFVPGIIFLSCLKLKHHHYSMPILPPLTIPAALGLDYYVRRQTSRKPGLVWPFFLAGCAVGALIVKLLPQIPAPTKAPIIALIAIFAVGGLASLYFEQLKRPALIIASYFLTAWAIGVGIQSWVMPAQDDFSYQADFAKKIVNGRVPPGVTIYLLGHREEEQEAEYAYYLRFPMQRLTSAADFAAVVHDDPVYAIAPAGFLPELTGIGQIQTLAACNGLRVRETESDRLELIRVTALKNSPQI